MAGFTTHIKDAIRINRKRKQYYARVSGGGTRRLSNFLIALEFLVLPIAKYYDLKAARFTRAEIGVVRDDFAEMIVKPMESKPTFIHVLSAKIYDSTLAKIKAYLKMVGDLNDFKTIEEISLEFLNIIKNDEQNFEIHLAMLGHLIESAIKIAHNGAKYNLLTKGESEGLSFSLLRLHFFAIRHALVIDRMANKFHKQGIGIIVNDLPEIVVSL